MKRHKLPAAWRRHRVSRDNSPSLLVTEGRELALLSSRFAKAISLANAIEGEGVTAEQVEEDFTPDQWRIVSRIARVGSEPSSQTRLLVVLLLRDRESRR